MDLGTALPRSRVARDRSTLSLPNFAAICLSLDALE
jgi:hypothetical protein